ncbi:MAG: hypothetical protein JW984_00860 [Deltaproteobacteria bacterium]|uniref:Uncharacterized protein n=1 Tax=Candidatus Zymogenus saltonus TaxID=2844893 RepID=A0A9D8PKR2_9DELT|nr:hypothetical protein [Candidatus Zymogenus saltonus]
MSLCRRFVFVLLVASVFFVVSGLDARAEWNGIVPNVTTKSQVLSMLGEPSLDSGLVMIYDGQKSPEDTKGVAIFLVNDIVVMVRIIPGKQLTMKWVSVKFGDPKQVSVKNPELEEHVFDSESGKVIVIFTKRNKTPIRIDYL